MSNSLAHSPASAEVPSPQGLEPRNPEPQDPELYLVADPDDPTAIETEAGAEDNVSELSAYRGRAAKQTGRRVLKGVTELGFVDTKHSETVRRHRGGSGGGSWRRIKLRKEKLKAEAKARAAAHEDGCGCQDCEFD